MSKLGGEAAHNKHRPRKHSGPIHDLCSGKTEELPDIP
jgi:hypothetical protein